MKSILILGALGVLSACTTTQVSRTLATADQVIADGQLVCKIGPTVVAMLAPSGAEILAKGASKSAVDTVCGLVNGAAVALPAASVQPAGLVVALPRSVTIPLKP